MPSAGPRWRIYYADGRTASSDDSDEFVNLAVSRAWLQAPADGVLVVAIEDPNTGRMLLSGRDAYYAHPAGGHARGAIGQADDLGPFLRDIGLVKYGVWTDPEHFQATMMRAADDPYIKILTQEERDAFKKKLLGVK